jgi:SAM-dependent methyltransferase
VNSETVAKLLELNYQFYQTFALQFSATRERLQPGVQRVIECIHPKAHILDLGCGNGELARELVRRQHRGTYVGLDFSETLIQEAQRRLHQTHGKGFVFLPADLSTPDWDRDLPRRQFDFILAFAVLHHLPGEQLRWQVVHRVRALLTSQGQFIHSNWQFLNSPRLRKRIQPWESIGMSASDIDPEDYLLDWRRGGHGLRYVHHFSEEQLDDLASATGFQRRETFYSDGQGGRLGLYQIWEPAE